MNITGMNITGMGVNSRIACAPWWRSIQRLLHRRPSVQKDPRTRVKRPANSRTDSTNCPFFKPYGGEPYEAMNSTLQITQSGYFLTGRRLKLAVRPRIELRRVCRYSQQKEPAERRS